MRFLFAKGLSRRASQLRFDSNSSSTPSHVFNDVHHPLKPALSKSWSLTFPGLRADSLASSTRDGLTEVDLELFMRYTFSPKMSQVMR